MNVAILARVSRQEQATADRHSLPVQEAMLRAWAEREGWHVAVVYQIPGESAYRDYMAERPQFAVAIRAAFSARAEFVSAKCQFTPDRNGALTRPSGFTLADLAVAS